MTPREIRMNAMIVLTNCPPTNLADIIAVLDEARRLAPYLDDGRLPDDGNNSSSNPDS